MIHNITIDIILSYSIFFLLRFKRMRLAEQLQRRSDSLINIEDREGETERI